MGKVGSGWIVRGEATVQIYTSDGGDLMCAVNEALEQCFSKWVCVLYVTRTLLPPARGHRRSHSCQQIHSTPLINSCWLKYSSKVTAKGSK